MAMGDRIREAIEGSEKTKAQIARECDVTGGAVSQWLSGNVQSLKADTALKLEAATGYRANWLLHGKGPKKATEPVTLWPFTKIPMERFTALDEGDQGYVERRMLQAIQECEGQRIAAVPPQAATPIIHPPEIGKHSQPRDVKRRPSAK
jgi:transcriptional regulator with XRE-family HTH domain